MQDFNHGHEHGLRYSNHKQRLREDVLISHKQRLREDVLISHEQRLREDV